MSDGMGGHSHRLAHMRNSFGHVQLYTETIVFVGIIVPGGAIFHIANTTTECEIHSKSVCSTISHFARARDTKKEMQKL